MVMNVDKYLENRHQALKWMYAQPNGFTTREVKEKFHVTSSFLSAVCKKSLTKTFGPLGTKYIGGEPTIKTAVEVYDYEKQLLGKKVNVYSNKTIDLDNMNVFKESVKTAQRLVQANKTNSSERIADRTTESIHNNFSNPINTKSINVTIEGEKVTMSWKDFSKLMTN